MSVRRSHARRDPTAPPRRRRYTAEELQAMATGAPGRECISFMHPLVGVIMRCTSPCDRCRTLAQEYADAAPERERARQEYEATNPKKATEAAHRDGPHVPTDDFEADA